MRERRGGTGVAVALLLVALLCGAAALAGGGTAGGDGPLGLAASASAAPPRLDGRNRGRLDDLVRFLQDTQNDDGGYGGQPGAPSDPGFSAWVGIGLAAAGINPQDQRIPGGRRSLADYVARKGPVSTGSDGQWLTTELERIGMLANAAGLDPRRFGGRDYVTPLLARQGATTFAGSGPDGQPIQVPPGWFPHTATGRSPGVNDTIFAVFFLSGVGDRRLAPAIGRAAVAIEAMQRRDGTWPATRAGGPTDVDMTGAAIQALCVAGRCAGAAVRGALDWLRAHQQRDGGWSFSAAPGESNAGTTPWVVQALWAAGIDPRSWRSGGRDPLDFLASLQRRDGSIRWKRSADMNPTWMTAYAAPAFAGHPWPVPAPPRAAAVRRQRQAQAQARERRRAQ
ncbi:prenyltransferase/squalene oxidase repeat-containing protein, partial [Patulibacter medicamentivorans]|uniref:prenyltransferase/squalene oxidase repeat-containing protein n=1 Tax=Patulibacter medicamentivorans TaxID=1097667 RepID=UPI001B8CDC26